MNKNVATLETKAELKSEVDKITELQVFDASYFRSKSHFEDGGTQNYLLFQPMYKYFQKIDGGDHISSWKSKELSDEKIKLPATSNNSLALSLNYIGTKIRVKFEG